MATLQHTNQLKTYRETQIKTANQGKLVVMLYEGAVRFLNQAIDGLGETPRRYDRISRDVIRVQDIIAELMVSLDMEKGGDIAGNLLSLYLYINRLLLDGNIRKDTAPLMEARGILQELKIAWADIADRKGVESVPGAMSGINLAG